MPTPETMPRRADLTMSSSKESEEVMRYSKKRSAKSAPFDRAAPRSFCMSSRLTWK
jgi:hypothetical protein